MHFAGSPVPVYPASHMQKNDPSVLLHRAKASHELLSRHSSISEKLNILFYFIREK